VGFPAVLSDGCKIVYRPPNCEVRRRSGTILYSLPNSHARFFSLGLRVHDVDAEELCLSNRHLCVRPKPTPESIESMRVVLDHVSVPLMSRWGRNRILQSRNGLRRRRYERGFEQLYSRGIRPADAHVTMMLKLEFHPISKLEIKEDRCIQYRSVTYNAAIARYLMPFEHWFLSADLNNHGFPCVMKGVTNLDMAHYIWAAWKQFRRPMALLLDHARFDSSVTVEHLELEHSFYKRSFPRDRVLAHLLKSQLRNSGSTQSGLRYKTVGKRMSGDVNTSLGNTLINYAVMRSVLGPDGILFVNGDDTVYLCEQRPWDEGQLVKKFIEHGFNTEFVAAYHYTDIDFCQTRFFLFEDGPQLLPNPRKVLEGCCITPQRVPNGEIPGLLAAKLQSALMMYWRLPLLGALLKIMLDTVKAAPRYDTNTYQETCAAAVHETVVDHRFDWGEAYQYYNSFGCDMEEAISLVSGAVGSNALFSKLRPLCVPTNFCEKLDPDDFTQFSSLSNVVPILIPLEEYVNSVALQRVSKPLCYG
jgi:hypothetical protein